MSSLRDEVSIVVIKVCEQAAVGGAGWKLFIILGTCRAAEPRNVEMHLA